MVRLSKAFYLTSPIVSLVASMVLGVGIFFMMRQDIAGASPFLVLGGIGLVYAAVVALMLYYKMWDSIQDGYARTSPGKAIGFLFIPFFNFYWVFQVMWGFAKDYNAYVDRYAINSEKLPEGLFLAFSILPFTTWIPFLGVLTGLAQAVLFFMVVALVCDAVNALPPLGDQAAAGSVLGLAGAAEPAAGRMEPRAEARPLALYCLSGEFEHETVVVPADGVSIGRDPTRVNLVLAAGEISGVHARVLPDTQSGQMWLEDLRSMNGTFYSQGGHGAESGWVQLQGKTLLPPGARFRLAVDGPVFEIRRL